MSKRTRFFQMHSLFICLLIFLFTVINRVDAQKYVTQQHTGKNGYLYETVTNDPVGLRLYTLKNGLKVYLTKNKDPFVLYATATRVGYKYDPADNTGLAHYQEHLLFNGTDKLGSLNWTEEKPLLDKIEGLYEIRAIEKDSLQKREITKIIDSLSYKASLYGVKNEYRSELAYAGILNGNGVTNFESAVYGSSFPPGSLEYVLALEKERFRKQVYRAFATELEIVYEEFNSFQDNAFMQKYYAANKLLFPTHPYGRPGIGTAEHLKNPSVRAIREFTDQYYVPNNMAVIIAGEIDFDKTIQWVDNAFGWMLPKPVKHPSFAPEKEIIQPVSKEITNADRPSVFMAFRMKGIGSEDEPCFALTAKLLENTSYGLLKEEVRATQKIADANSYSMFMHNDYGAHYLEGVARPGQDLDEVKDALLGFLNKIKTGDFDENLIKACAKEIKLSFIKDITVKHNLDAECANLFIHYQSWRGRLEFIDRLQKLTKTDIMAFANRIYKNNYAILYKKQGESNSLIKIENPKLTPLAQHDSTISSFVRSLRNTIKITAPILAVVNYEKEIHRKKIREGVELVYVENKQNDIFELDIIFGIGRRVDKNVALAVNYIPFAATSTFSAAEIKKEFFMMGLTFRATVQEDRTIFHLEGLPENMARGVELLNHIIQDIQPSKQTYDAYVSSIMNGRKAALSNKISIRNALYNYALYGNEMPLRNSYSEAELKDFNLKVLAETIRKLTEYEHRIFFFGKKVETAENILRRYYQTAVKPGNVPPKKITDLLPAKQQVYFVDYDGSQAEVYFLVRGEKFQVEDMAYINMLNRFIGQITFQEVREKRSLAYNTWGNFYYADHDKGYNLAEINASTQVSKLSEALQVMSGLTKNISSFETGFENARKEQLKAYESENIIGSRIFWNYEDHLGKLNINTDRKQALYEQTKQMTFAGFIRFFNDNIANKQASLVIVGSKKDVDIKALSAFGEVKEIKTDELFNYH